MLHVTFVRLPEAGVARLRAWLESLPARREELVESYRRQHTRQELFYLFEGKDDPILVIVSDSENAPIQLPQLSVGRRGAAWPPR
ncbi:MAG: hypothetical protein ACR2N5_00540, partial [Solirubrobacterales bacterium]